VGLYKIFWLWIISPFVFVGKLSNRRFVIKNDVSYGIYIYGRPVAQVIAYFAIKRNVGLNPLIYFLLIILVVVPISFLSGILLKNQA